MPAANGSYNSAEISNNHHDNQVAPTDRKVYQARLLCRPTGQKTAPLFRSLSATQARLAVQLPLHYCVRGPSVSW